MALTKTNTSKLSTTVKIFRVLGASGVLGISLNMVACLARNSFSDAIATVPFILLGLITLSSAIICRKEIRASVHSPHLRAMYSVLLQGMLGFVFLGLMLYLFGHRYHTRIALSGMTAQTLSEETLHALGQLAKSDESLEAVYLVGVDPSQPEERARLKTIRTSVQTLLREYEIQANALAAGAFRFTPLRVLEEPERLNVLAKRTGIKTFTRNMNEAVILLRGERSKLILMTDLFKSVSPASPNKKVFRGEAVFTSILRKLLTGETQKIYFTKGHGEQPGKNITAFKEMLTRENTELFEVDTTTSSIPKDCHLLICCGPRTSLSKQEQEKWKSYLANGGRLLLFADPVLKSQTSLASEPCGAQDLLKSYGITLQQELMTRSFQTDIIGNLIPISDLPAFPNPTSASALLTSLRLERTPVFYSYPCVVRAQDNKDNTKQLRSEELLRTASDQDGQTQTYAAASESTEPTKGKRPTDAIKSPIPLAAWSSKEILSDTSEKEDPREARIVVIASSRTVANATFLGHSGNQIFLRASVLWLLGEDQLSGKTQSKTTDIPLVVLDASDASLLFTLFGVALPGLVLFLGGIVWAIRRN